jgi:hypothetical protein
MHSFRSFPWVHLSRPYKLERLDLMTMLVKHRSSMPSDVVDVQGGAHLAGLLDERVDDLPPVNWRQVARGDWTTLLPRSGMDRAVAPAP